MFLSVSRFAVANDRDEAVREAFRNRPHLVDKVAGFIRMEVATSCDNPKEFRLLTWWQDEDTFKAWHRSHAYQESHHGMPKGLKLDPAQTSLIGLKVFAE